MFVSHRAKNVLIMDIFVCNVWLFVGGIDTKTICGSINFWMYDNECPFERLFDWIEHIFSSSVSYDHILSRQLCDVSPMLIFAFSSNFKFSFTHKYKKLIIFFCVENFHFIHWFLQIIFYTRLTFNKTTKAPLQPILFANDRLHIPMFKYAIDKNKNYH